MSNSNNEGSLLESATPPPSSNCQVKESTTGKKAGGAGTKQKKMEQPLQTAIKSGWDYIEDQGEMIWSLQQEFSESEVNRDNLKDRIAAQENILELTKNRLEHRIAKKTSELGIKNAKIQALISLKKLLEATISVLKVGKATDSGPTGEEMLQIKNTKAHNKIMVSQASAFVKDEAKEFGIRKQGQMDKCVEDRLTRGGVPMVSVGAN
jgi:hypothetical protein